MEDKLKILELKVKLYKEITIAQRMLVHNLKGITEASLNILRTTKNGESTDEQNMFNMSKEELTILENALYTAKSDTLTCNSSQSYIKDYAEEIRIKQEILNML